MSNIYKQITHYFHSQNKTVVKRCGVCSVLDYTLFQDTFNNTNKIIRKKNLSPGLYAFNTDKTCCMVTLPNALTGDDELVIENKSNVYMLVNNKRTHLIPYEMPISFTSKSLQYMLQAQFVQEVNKNYVTISNSVNTYMDMIAVSGLTTLSNDPSPFKPAELISLGSFNVESRGVTKEQYSVLTINLNNNIKSLPCGKCDLFVMDSVHKTAYIIYYVSRIAFTGSEKWITIDENNTYCTYFHPLNTINYEADYGAIISNYFPSYGYYDLINDNTITYGICNSLDSKNPGIYVRIPTKSIGNTGVDNFKRYLKYQLNRRRPVIAEYLAKDIRVKSVLLDSYDIKQYAPVTNININAETTAAFFFKTLKYEDDPEKRQKQSRKLQFEI